VNNALMNVAVNAESRDTNDRLNVTRPNLGITVISSG
jgi:hypothetical protein